MDIEEVDEKGKGVLFYGKVPVEKCKKINGQGNIYFLQITIQLERTTQVTPKPGQFYLLKSENSCVNYNRPISVYFVKEHFSCSGKKKITIQFLIQERGRGTKELCHLKKREKVFVIGPLGNSWPIFNYFDIKQNENPKICIVGAGIGIAPVANLASILPQKTYDFYASFKSSYYGLKNINPKNLIISTEDGSYGKKGILSDFLTKEECIKKGYKIIYGCGPEKALLYLKNLSSELGIKCYISMEHRMLCGLGACLGCTIETTEGLKRCCKDGPVFDASTIKFNLDCNKRKCLNSEEEVDLSVNIAGVHFKNPVIASAGTFAYGQNYRGVSDVTYWGGICSKGITLEAREGNKGERCLEVAGGNMNSIGLQNPGIPYFVENLLPGMMELGPVVIANLAGSDIESYVEGAKLLDKTNCPMIELNISCPNIKSQGLPWGISAESAYYCVSKVRAVTSKPLMVKLSPNAPDNGPIAVACIKAGANAISLINMIHGVAVDIYKGKPFFNNIHAGYSGPGIKPIALRMVYDVVAQINKLPPEERVPVVGIGGISCWQDAVEFIMAGAYAVEIGQAKFSNPHVALDIITGMKNFMKKEGYRNLEEMRGIAQILNT